MSDETSLGPYDRIKTIVHGAKLTARPIDFVYDDDGKVIEAIKWETVHPNTGELLQFTRPEVQWIDDTAIIGEYTKKEENVVRISRPIKKKVEKSEIIIDECPFLDPIEIGLFVV